MKKIRKYGKYICLVMLALFLLAGCGMKKEPISIDTFTKTMTDANFYVFTNPTQDDVSTYASKSKVAKSKNQTTVIFYESQTEENAITAYVGLKNSVDIAIQKNNTENYTETPHFQQYISQSENVYSIVERIDNTVLFAFCNLNHKDELTEILETIGY